MIRRGTLALIAAALCIWGGPAAAAPDSEAAVVSEASTEPGAAAEPAADGEPGEEAEPEPEPEPKRKWITHRVVPREKFEDIGARYGVSRGEIVRWNKKKLGKKEWIYAGQTLKIFARRRPPPRQKITYRVAFGDTWSKIASKYRVKVSDLRGWNKKVPKQFKAGTKLVVYTNPKVRASNRGGGGNAEPLPEIDVRSGGRAIGKPHRGKLVGGVRLPKSKLYTLRDPDKSYGTTHAVRTIHTAIAAFRRDSGYTGKLTIADLSKRGGGRMRPHKSHQAGRDADIRLPRKKGASKKSSGSSSIDWAMSWRLIKAFIDTGEVEYIFLDYSRQKHLLEAAKAAGESGKQLRKYIQYPQGSRKNRGVVRHSKGHNVHIHVRVKCAPGNRQCLTV